RNKSSVDVMGSVPSEAWFRTEDSEFRTDSSSGFRSDSGLGSDWIEWIFKNRNNRNKWFWNKTFSKHNQAIDIVNSNIWMVVNELMELGFETSTEELDGINVFEVVQ
ncbi:hypothetical protein BGZ59_000545, partial [Podila verticillata]